MPVAAAQTPMNGFFSALAIGTMASDTGESMPPKSAATCSLKISSRAAVTPFEGFDSSSRRTSSSVRPPTTPPLALISSMATVSPRVMASPEAADWPERAARAPSAIVRIARASHR